MDQSSTANEKTLRQQAEAVAEARNRIISKLEAEVQQAREEYEREIARLQQLLVVSEQEKLQLQERLKIAEDQVRVLTNPHQEDSKPQSPEINHYQLDQGIISEDIVCAIEVFAPFDQQGVEEKNSSGYMKVTQPSSCTSTCLPCFDEFDENESNLFPTIRAPFTNDSLRVAVNLWCSDRTQAIKLYGHITGWNTSVVTDMSELFKDKKHFNDNINNWDVANVTSMGYMFCRASSFNQPLDQWNVGKVTDMSNMFNGASHFNQPLDQWNVQADCDVKGMFLFAASYSHSKTLKKR
jgi:surface protein